MTISPTQDGPTTRTLSFELTDSDPLPPAFVIQSLELLVAGQLIARPTIGTLRLSRALNGQVDLRVRVPQVHAGQRAMQGQLLMTNTIDMLRVSLNQVLVHSARMLTHYLPPDHVASIIPIQSAPHSNLEIGRLLILNLFISYHIGSGDKKSPALRRGLGH